MQLEEKARRCSCMRCRDVADAAAEASNWWRGIDVANSFPFCVRAARSSFFCDTSSLSDPSCLLAVRRRPFPRRVVRSADIPLRAAVRAVARHGLRRGAAAPAARRDRRAGGAGRARRPPLPARSSLRDSWKTAQAGSMILQLTSRHITSSFESVFTAVWCSSSASASCWLQSAPL